MSSEPPIIDPFLAPPEAKGSGKSKPEPDALGGNRGTLGEGERPHEPPRTSGNAITALVFALLGFVCLPAVGGLLALTFGIVAKGEIARSEGTRTGSAMSVISIVLGALNVVVSVVGLALLIGLVDSPSATSSPPPYAPSPRYAPTVLPTSPGPSPPLVSPGGPKSGSSSQDTSVVVTRIGGINLVDIGTGVRSLSAELDNQKKLAQKDGKKLLLWVVVDGCQPCNGVAASLSDQKMQTALGSVRLARVNTRDFLADLQYLGIPVEKVPGFVLLGPTNRPVDYVNGGEWDEDVPRNIAPVLGNFVRGSYSKRRDPWRGAHRDDETTL